MTHILEDLTHKMEGHPPKKGQLVSRCIYYVYRKIKPQITIFVFVFDTDLGLQTNTWLSI